MSQANQLLDTLKRALRDRGQTYADLARGLGVSESSVKRLFSKRRLSLERLEQVCEHLNLELSDLVEMSRAASDAITSLTEEQEQALVADAELLLVGLLALNHWGVGEITSIYRFTEAEVVRHLLRLERLEILELLPGNRIRLRLARNFSWRKDGPLQRFFAARVQNEFLDSAFDGPRELRFVVHGSLSEASNRLLQQRLARVVEEFDELTREDRRGDRAGNWGTTMVVAIRPWEMGLFAALRRPAIATPASAAPRPVARGARRKVKA